MEWINDIGPLGFFGEISILRVTEIMKAQRNRHLNLNSQRLLKYASHFLSVLMQETTIMDSHIGTVCLFDYPKF